MYKVSSAVRSTHSQDGAIVLDVRQGQMFNLNFVGSRILELLKNGSTEAAIVAGISREFGIGRDLAENDVREFLQTLKKCHLVEEHGLDGGSDLEPRSSNRRNQSDQETYRHRAAAEPD